MTNYRATGEQIGTGETINADGATAEAAVRALMGRAYGPHPGSVRVYPHRRLRAEGCGLCERADSMEPPHDASPNCKSGGHNHCTCDTCF